MDNQSAPESGINIWTIYEHNVFEPIKLYYAVDGKDLTKTESIHVKLTVFVTYSTCYIDDNGKIPT